ncbi:MAG: hypothetical protein OXC08_03025, partial [Thiotrichales bacterium]|nr:hypothetical protein [Thiotrichales bacterium]
HRLSTMCCLLFPYVNPFRSAGSPFDSISSVSSMQPLLRWWRCTSNGNGSLPLGAQIEIASEAAFRSCAEEMLGAGSRASV